VTRPPFHRRQCLLRRAQLDPDAFAAFYDAYSRRVLVFFARRVGHAETAIDLMSETFAKALEHRTQFRGRTPQEEQGWLFAIARSELSHFWRRGAVERSAVARLGLSVPVLSPTDLERIEELAGLEEVGTQLLAAMRSLPSDQRTAVKLRVVDEMAYRELAETLGVSELVVRARVSRGLRALARDMAGPDTLLEGTG
jgi:RNA polymerase sigma-70 factor (ECF subfamily)